MIPYGRHSIDKNDFNSLKKCINTGQLTQGEFTKNLKKLIKICGSNMLFCKQCI